MRIAAVMLALALFVAVSMLVEANTHNRRNGDVNLDDLVNAEDATIILQMRAALIGTISSQVRGDVDLDLDADEIDAALILQMDAGLIGGRAEDLPLMPGFFVNTTGCSSVGNCLPYDILGTYALETFEVVVQPDAGPQVIAHETCHGHQHVTTEAAGLTIWEWVYTDEGQSFMEAGRQVEGMYGIPDFRGNEDRGAIEWFAGRCAEWLAQPMSLFILLRPVYDWFVEQDW